MTTRRVTVVALEARTVTFVDFKVPATGAFERGPTQDWDPSGFATDATGLRLLEEVARRLKAFWRDHRCEADSIVIAMPGTLEDTSKIRSSSRLSIREPVDAGRIVHEQTGKPCCIFHDVECLAIGQMAIGDPVASCMVYIHVDEGVGSKIIFDGRPYAGRGVAGLLGRLVVQPDGAYDTALRSSGSLEVFTSRPWVSERLVATYESERDKHEITSPELEESKFRKGLRVAATRDRTQLTYALIAAGLDINDPIAESVIEVAARYMGFAVNAVITILNPDLILLGGRMITELPEFHEKVVRHARRLSWPMAWNSTHIEVSTLGSDALLYGALELWRSHQARSK